MKYRNTAKFCLIVTLLFFLLLFALSACGKKDEGVSPVLNVEITDEGTLRNGQENEYYQVEDAPVELQISVLRESGSLSLSIYPEAAPNQSVYQGTGLPTSDFSVILSEPGSYQVTVLCKDFVGSYSISSRTLEQNS